jgi:hypothetical protein
MELEIRELPSADEKTRQMNHLASFKAELRRLQQEYNHTKRRVQRQHDRSQLLNDGDDIEDSNYFEVDVTNNAKDR